MDAPEAGPATDAPTIGKAHFRPGRSLPQCNFKRKLTGDAPAMRQTAASTRFPERCAGAKPIRCVTPRDMAKLADLQWLVEKMERLCAVGDD
jgi:hypothetical protein